MERAELTDLLRTWKPPAGLNRAWPREVQLNRKGIFVVVLAFVLVAGGMVLAVWLQSVAGRDTARTQLLSRDGADARATITRLWRAGGGEDSTHWVAFEFPVAGRIEARRTKVRSSAWKKLTVGETVPVRYLPSNPSISYLSGSEPKPMATWVTWLIGAATAFPGGLLLPFLIRRERKLLSDGRAAPAVVTRLRRSEHGSMVHYEFAIAGGGFAKGRTGPSRKPPAVGAIVPVLYNPENPRRNRMYPFSMVKLAEY